MSRETLERYTAAQVALECERERCGWPDADLTATQQRYLDLLEERRDKAGAAMVGPLMAKETITIG